MRTAPLSKRFNLTVYYHARFGAVKYSKWKGKSLYTVPETAEKPGKKLSKMDDVILPVPRCIISLLCCRRVHSIPFWTRWYFPGQLRWSWPVCVHSTSACCTVFPFSVQNQTALSECSGYRRLHAAQEPENVSNWLFSVIRGLHRGD